jgi:hypothetical protein
LVYVLQYKETIFLSKEKLKNKILIFFAEKLAENKICTKFALAISNYCNSIGLWCNGNTTVFGAVFLGSSPSRPTKKLSEMRAFFVSIRLIFTTINRFFLVLQKGTV